MVAEMATSSNLELLINKLDSSVKLILTIIATLLLPFALQAQAQTTIKLRDSAGNELPNAVVWAADDAVKAGARMTPQQVNIDQVNRQFTPFMTVIRKGSEVTFPNSDNIRHHVYSFSEPKPFEIKLYANEERPTLAFEQAGLVTLGCNIHDQMIAHIVITERESAWISNAAGVVELPLVAANGPVAVTIWHPWMGADLVSAKSVEIEPGTSNMLTLEVTPPQREEKPKSRLEQRFNRTGSL